MFYGNGTARLVRDSVWRDQDGGVIPDLGSHLLDTCRFWFGDISDDARLISASRFENRAPDHAIFIADNELPDWGDAQEFARGDVPEFWACGVTPQAVALASRPPFMITHSPGHMFITDVPNSALAAI